MPIIPPDEECQPASLEDRIATSRRIREMFAPQLVPYEEWAAEIDALCRERAIILAAPADFPQRMGVVARVITPPAIITAVEHLLRYQETFYRAAYADLRFTIDRAKLGLPRERLDDIKAALLRGEVNYPLVVCLPRTLSLEETGVTRRRRPTPRLPVHTLAELVHAQLTTPEVPQPERAASEDGHRLERGPTWTLHRVLFERLIRQRNVPVTKREFPTVDEILEQVRDVTLADLTRRDLLGPDGTPFDFTPGNTWREYLEALYLTLPRPTAQPGYTDLSFVAWEQNPPADRIIVGGRGAPGAATIQGKTQLTAVAFEYPLITPSRYFALLGQYHAATRQVLDTSTLSRTFGIIDPTGVIGSTPFRCGYMVSIGLQRSGVANLLLEGAANLLVDGDAQTHTPDRLRSAR